MWGLCGDFINFELLKYFVMASINPIITGKSTIRTIHIRLRKGRKHDYSASSGLLINPKDWNKQTKRPKETTAKLKNLKSDLDDLISFIQHNLNKITRDGLEPSKKWLENITNTFFNKESKEQNAEIIYWINYISDNPKLFKNSVGKKGLSENRVKQLKTLKGVFEKYQKNHNYKVIEINQLFYDKFFIWLADNQKYAHNTAKKYSDDILATGRHARTFKIPCSTELNTIDRVKAMKIKPIVIEEDEIQKIINASLEKKYQENARKWLLLGFQLAQRVSDLLPLTEQNIQYIPNLKNELVKCFVFIQKKSQGTKEMVLTIDEQIEELLNDGFPTKISSQKFNLYIKEVCKIAKIDKLTNGSISKVIKVDGKKVKRNVEGVYAKHELITSHTMRKTGTTHYYQVFGAKAKHFSGHDKEETLNLYVNDDRSRKVSQGQQLRKEFFQYKKEEEKKKKESKLTIVKSSSS